MFVFEKDENGKLHQADITLADVRARGKRVSASVIQCYIMSTDAEDAEFKKRQEEDLAKIAAEEAARAEAKALADKRQLEDSIRAQELKAAQAEAAAAQNTALIHALEQIEALNKKIEALTSPN